MTSRLRDLIGNCPVKEAANACMEVADAIQRHENKGARLMGLATAFLIAAEEAGITISDLMTYARNCMNHAEGRRTEFKAVSTYINKEIING